MKIRFTGSVSVLGGPRYHAGEVVETDPYQLTEALAERLIARGHAERVVETRALDGPPADRMLRRPGVKR